jgi:hypothetical protein
MRRWEGFSIYIALAKRAGEFLFIANILVLFVLGTGKRRREEKKILKRREY